MDPSFRANPYPFYAEMRRSRPLVLGATNRDERVFQNPDQCDLHRGEHGIPFGFGIHACLGAALVRLEARLLLEALLAQAQGFICPPSALVWNRSLTVRGPLAMPIRLVR